VCRRRVPGHGSYGPMLGRMAGLFRRVTATWASHVPARPSLTLFFFTIPLDFLVLAGIPAAGRRLHQP
jgi:hypothetical protein